MSGPGGASTKRDQRRDTRRQQFQARQLERQRERERQLRNQRIRQWSIYGGVAAVLLIIGVIIYNAFPHSGASTTTGQQPASGQTVDGIECQSMEGAVLHIHTALQLYVNNQQVTIPAGAGIVAPTGGLTSNGVTTCLYALHVHDGEPNLIHVESPTQRDYTVANFFHIWGKQLSDTSFMGNPIDATHKLTMEIYDDQGKLVETYTGKLADLKFQNRRTYVVRYNSDNVKPTLFDWSKF